MSLPVFFFVYILQYMSQGFLCMLHIERAKMIGKEHFQNNSNVILNVKYFNFKYIEIFPPVHSLVLCLSPLTLHIFAVCTTDSGSGVLHVFLSWLKIQEDPQMRPETTSFSGAEDSLQPQVNVSRSNSTFSCEKGKMLFPQNMITISGKEN